MPPIPGLNLRKLADKSSGERVTKFDPDTGAKRLVNPATPGDDHEPWPLAGVKILDDPIPTLVRLSTNIVELGRHEGWIELENEREVYRHGGPPENPRRLIHGLLHADAIIIKTIDGDVRFRVTRQPDKYAVVDRDDSGKYLDEITDDKKKVTDEIYAAGNTKLDKFYDLKLVS